MAPLAQGLEIASVIGTSAEQRVDVIDLEIVVLLLADVAPAVCLDLGDELWTEATAGGLGISLDMIVLLIDLEREGGVTLIPEEDPILVARGLDIAPVTEAFLLSLLDLRIVPSQSLRVLEHR